MDPWECSLGLCLVDDCAGVSGLFREGSGGLKGAGDVTLLCASSLVGSSGRALCV